MASELPSVGARAQEEQAEQPTSEPAIQATGLTRTYRRGRGGEDVLALDAIDLVVHRGEIRGLLGPNGAGKTTLAKILATILLPTSGTAHIHGYDVVKDARHVRPLIGLVFGGDRGLYTRLTARQNLYYWAALYGVPRRTVARVASDLLEQFGLHDRADDRVETFSRGMRQRLHMARGMIGDPQVLLLDEPTMGLDPMASESFREHLRDIRDQGRTILLATHDMHEAETVCDRLTLIDQGQVIATEQPSVIGRWFSGHEWVEVRHIPTTLTEQLATEVDVSSVEHRPDGWTRFHPTNEEASAELVRRIVGAGHTSIRTGSPSLEETYLRAFSGRGMRV